MDASWRGCDIADGGKEWLEVRISGSKLIDVKVIEILRKL